MPGFPGRNSLNQTKPVTPQQRASRGSDAEPTIAYSGKVYMSQAGQNARMHNAKAGQGREEPQFCFMIHRAFSLAHAHFPFRCDLDLLTSYLLTDLRCEMCLSAMSFLAGLTVSCMDRNVF